MKGGNYNYHRDEVYLQSQNQFRNIFRVTFKKVLKYKRQGCVLEVGSSTGLLLKEFKDKGWYVQGIEPSKKSSEYSEKIGIKVLKTTFEKALVKEKYDVVILNHVLEHLVDPTKVLQKIYKVLKSDGIVVINVPNAGSLSARIYGESWAYRLPEEHLWQFTPDKLVSLLKENGFKVLEWSAISGIWEYNNPLLEIWQALKGGKKRFFTDVLTAVPTWFISQARLGTGLSVIAQKQ